MSNPVIRPLPPAPSPGESADVYDARVYAFSGALVGFGDDLNAAIAWLAPRVEAVGGAALQVADDRIAVADAANQVALNKAAVDVAAGQVAADRATVVDAAGHVDADRQLATDAAAAAQAAAETSGPVEFFDNYAAASAAAAGMADDQIVEVFVDETLAGQRSRYRVTGGALVYKTSASGIIGTPSATISGTAFALSQAHRQCYLRFTAAEPVAVSIAPALGVHEAADEWALNNAAAGPLTLVAGVGVAITGPTVLAPGDYATVKRTGTNSYDVMRVVRSRGRATVVLRTALATTDSEVMHNQLPGAAHGAQLLVHTYAPIDPAAWLHVRVSVPVVSSGDGASGCVVWLRNATATLAIGTAPVFPPGSAPFAGSLEITALVPAAASHDLQLRFAPINTGTAYVGTWDGTAGGFNFTHAAQMLITELDDISIIP